MQRRHEIVDLDTDPNIVVGRDDSRGSVVEISNALSQSDSAGYSGEVLRSYRDVYQTVCFALDHPMSWYFHRARRIRSSYGLPVVWSVIGCICGMGYAVLQHKMTPSVNLPSKSEMTAVFALHDLNEVLMVTNPPIGDKP